jgi:PhnB protein
MEISTYLTFDGQCAEAFKFYEKTLGGRIVTMQTFGETPARDHVSADWHGKVIHTRLEVEGYAIMGSDAPPPQFSAAQGTHVSVSVPQREAQRIFDALAQGGRVTMPYGETFWSPGFGMVVDQFGTPWMINAER